MVKIWSLVDIPGIRYLTCLPLRGADGYGAVVVVVASCLLANEVLHLHAVVDLPLMFRGLEYDTTVRRPHVTTSEYFSY